VIAAVAIAAALAQDARADAEEPPPTGAERLRIERESYPLAVERWPGRSAPGVPVLVLFHQARSSKGEYRPLAPHLCELGYECLLVDLGCGAESRGVKNRTAVVAAHHGFQPDFLDAAADVEDALRWAREQHPGSPILAWGSSYSASLALVMAGTKPELVDGVLAFSPGEYFKTLGKGETWVRDSAATIRCPVFVTSARSEEAEWRPIFEAIPAEKKTGFLPAVEAVHGSSALWPESAGHEECWKAVEAFLQANFAVPAAAAPAKQEPR
jgi:dienelactone hydrolase